jgi:hypothetical protein
MTSGGAGTVIAAAFVSATWIAGCGGGASDGSDVSDGTDVSVDTDVPVDAADVEDGAPRVCPEPIAERCEPVAGDAAFFPYPPYQLPVVLRASEVGSGVRFLALSQVGVLLAERLEAGARTLLVLLSDWDTGEAPTVRATLALPDGSDLRGVGAVARPAGAEGTALPDLTALLCDDERCRLYGADLGPEPAVLAELAGGEVPASGAMNGLWWSTGPAACVYGVGVHCFDGRDWTSPVPEGAACGPFRAMRTCEPRTIAVGDRGCRAISGSPVWTLSGGEPGAADLTAAACDGDQFVLGGSGGIEVESEGRLCPIAGEPIGFLDARRDTSQPYVVGVTASGRVFFGRGRPGPETPYCYTGQTVAPFVGAAAAYCGGAYNHNLLTEDTLFGHFLCVVEE